MKMSENFVKKSENVRKFCGKKRKCQKILWKKVKMSENFGKNSENVRKF